MTPNSRSTVWIGDDGRLHMQGGGYRQIWTYHSSADDTVRRLETRPEDCERGCWWEIEWGADSLGNKYIYETGGFGCVHRPVEFPEWATVTLGGVRYYTSGAELVVETRAVHQNRYSFSMHVGVETAAAANRMLGHDQAATLMPEAVAEKWQRILKCGEWVREELQIRDLERRLLHPAKSSEWRTRCELRAELEKEAAAIGVKACDLYRLAERWGEMAQPSKKAQIIAEWWEELQASVDNSQKTQDSGGDGSVEELLGW